MNLSIIPAQQTPVFISIIAAADNEYSLQDSLVLPSLEAAAVDAGTNTECLFIQPVVGRAGPGLREEQLTRLQAAQQQPAASVVKRSNTFSPSAPISKSQYNCRVSCFTSL